MDCLTNLFENMFHYIELTHFSFNHAVESEILIESTCQPRSDGGFEASNNSGSFHPFRAH